MDKYSLSFQQEEMWIAEQFYSTGNLWNIGGYSKLDSNIDPQLLSKASVLSLNSFSNFKARILVDKDGAPYQVFDEQVAFDYEYVDYLVDDESAISWMQKKMVEPLLSNESKLIYVAIIKTTNALFYFFKIHHLLSDFFGVKIMANMMMQIYAKLKDNQEILLQSLVGTDYRDYLVSQKAYLGSPTWLKDKEYWEKELSLKETVFSLFPKIQNNQLKSKVEYMVVDYLKKEALVKLAKDNNVSDFVFWLYLIGTTFIRMNSLEFFYLGVHFLNRINIKQKGNPGLFANSLPIKIGNNEFKEELSVVSKRVKNAFRHQQFPIKKISLPTDFYSVVVSFESYQKEEDIYACTLKSDESICPITFYIDNNKIQIVYHESIGMEKINEIIANLWETINRVIG